MLTFCIFLSYITQVEKETLCGGSSYDTQNRFLKLKGQSHVCPVIPAVHFVRYPQQLQHLTLWRKPQETLEKSVTVFTTG